MYEYIQDVGSVVDGAAHKPGFRVVFIIGNGKDDDSAHSMVQNGLVEKAYVYLDDLVNKDMEYGTDVRYVTKDGKVQLYNKYLESLPLVECIRVLSLRHTLLV